MGKAADTMAKQEENWAIESDANTLIEAEKIKKDKDRFKKAKAELKKRASAIKQSLS